MLAIPAGATTSEPRSVSIMAKKKESYSTLEVAKLLGKKSEPIWKWCNRKKINAHRMLKGSPFEIPKEEVERLLRVFNGEEAEG